MIKEIQIVRHLSKLSPVPSSGMQHFCFKVSFNMGRDRHFLHCPDKTFVSWRKFSIKILFYWSFINKLKGLQCLQKTMVLFFTPHIKSVLLFILALWDKIRLPYILRLFTILKGNLNNKRKPWNRNIGPNS